MISLMNEKSPRRRRSRTTPMREIDTKGNTCRNICIRTFAGLCQYFVRASLLSSARARPPLITGFRTTSRSFRRMRSATTGRPIRRGPRQRGASDWFSQAIRQGKMCDPDQCSLSGDDDRQGGSDCGRSVRANCANLDGLPPRPLERRTQVEHVLGGCGTEIRSCHEKHGAGFKTRPTRRSQSLVALPLSRPSTTTFPVTTSLGQKPVSPAATATFC
jgi:hypothetical protein